MTLSEYLSQSDLQYDPESHLVWSITKSPGYHTRVPDGERTRQTRGAMDYALANLQSDEPWRYERACDIIDTVANLQVTDPLDHHYGIWGWYVEEPPSQMNPADWNWADFIGARLAQVLAMHSSQIRASTSAVASTSLLHAALSIFRRNVTISYTNIAVMGGVVAYATGEALDMPFLRDYGKRRLVSVLQLTKVTGGFAEYNSPTYTRVALEEVERGLMIVRDEEVRATLESLREFCWQTLAERFHPGTGQMAGPNSRSYSDWLQPDMCTYLREQTGAPILSRGDHGERGNIAREDSLNLVRALPCPPQHQSRFRHLPVDPLNVVSRFSAGAHGDVIGTTWLTEEACLGSINRGNGWVQQRGLLGYWRTPSDPAVLLRTRMLNGGIDFAATRQFNAQCSQRILSTWCVCTDSGSFHPHFDKPKDSRFELSDWRLRISLQGKEVTGKKLDKNSFQLAASDWRAVIHTSAANLEGTPLDWVFGQEDDTVFLDAVIWSGAPKWFDFTDLILKLGFGLELLRAEEPAASDSVEVASTEDGLLHWRWMDIDLTMDPHPRPFGW